MQARPVTYRAEIIGPVLQSIAAGECCSIIGMSGVGKSNMVQHMLQDAVLRQHIGDQADTLHFVIVDTNMFADLSPWGFFEGLADALIASIGVASPPELRAHMHTAHQQILSAVGQHTLALRQCAEVLDTLCAQQRLVLLFDEFDPLFEQLAESTLRNLRGLRDRYKYRLMFLTFSRQPLPSLRDADDWEAIEPFVELLSLREIGLHPLSDLDAAAEVQRFAARHSQSITQPTQTKIVELSGGHPALIRALTQAALGGEPRIAIPTERLCQQPALRLECAKIWQQLTGDEQAGLVQLSRGKRLNPSDMQALELKGLARISTNATPRVFSTLFETYLKAFGQVPTQDAPAPISIDLERQIVIYYGRDISADLSRSQYQLLAYLWEHYGSICPIEQVVQALHPDTPRIYEYDTRDLDPLRTLARRLRNHLSELVPDQPVIFSIYKSRGYQLGLPVE